MAFGSRNQKKGLINKRFGSKDTKFNNIYLVLMSQ